MTQQFPQYVPHVAPQPASQPPGQPPGQPTSHREAKKEECRRAIAHAALALFEAKGFEETTIEEIAREAKCSRPTVFNYFAHKEDILPAAIVTLMRDRVMAAIPGGLEVALADPVESLRKLLVSNASVFQEYPQTGRAFHSLKMQQLSTHWRARPKGCAGENGALSPDLGADLESLPEPLVEFLGWLDVLILRAQEIGAFRSDFKSAELRFHLMIGLFASTLGPWMRGFYGDEDLSAIVGRHFNLFVEGLKA